MPGRNPNELIVDRNPNQKRQGNFGNYILIALAATLGVGVFDYHGTTKISKGLVVCGKKVTLEGTGLTWEDCGYGKSNQNETVGSFLKRVLNREVTQADLGDFKKLNGLTGDINTVLEPDVYIFNKSENNKAAKPAGIENPKPSSNALPNEKKEFVMQNNWREIVFNNDPLTQQDKEKRNEKYLNNIATNPTFGHILKNFVFDDIDGKTNPNVYNEITKGSKNWIELCNFYTVNNAYRASKGLSPINENSKTVAGEIYIIPVKGSRYECSEQFLKTFGTSVETQEKKPIPMGDLEKFNERLNVAKDILKSNGVDTKIIVGDPMIQAIARVEGRRSHVYEDGTIIAGPSGDDKGAMQISSKLRETLTEKYDWLKKYDNTLPTDEGFSNSIAYGIMGLEYMIPLIKTILEQQTNVNDERAFTAFAYNFGQNGLNKLYNFALSKTGKKTLTYDEFARFLVEKCSGLEYASSSTQTFEIIPGDKNNEVMFPNLFAKEYDYNTIKNNKLNIGGQDTNQGKLMISINYGYRVSSIAQKLEKDSTQSNRQQLLDTLRAQNPDNVMYRSKIS